MRFVKMSKKKTAILRAWRCWATAILSVSNIVPAAAQQKSQDLADRSLEDLMNIQVTSVSKKEQSLSQTAAAIFVIRQEDIRRSGSTNIPDLLRRVPGLEVAQINGHTWAISARGFNSSFSNKMLVLIDGRSVYSPLFSGVFWDVQDVMLEDIDRIEVIRGPGATLWGANAVNGVINIMMKKAKATQGGLVTVGAGSLEQGFGSTRWGGEIGSQAEYRVFAKYLNQSEMDPLPGRTARDQWQMRHTGFLVDWKHSSRDSFSVEGDIYGAPASQTYSKVVSFSPPYSQTFSATSELAGGDIVARWTRSLAGGSDLNLQFYFDRTTRDEPTFGASVNVYDLDLQHHFQAGSRQDIVWGAGYRFTSDRIGERFGLSVNPLGRGEQLFSAFVQDEITLVPKQLVLTLGTKFERNDYTGFEIQPAVRFLWTPHPRHSIWFAVSRAVRTPNRAEEDVQFIATAVPAGNGIEGFVTIFGNPAQRSETVLAYESGCRIELERKISLDIATFFNVYKHLDTQEPGLPFLQPSPAPPRLIIPFLYANNLHGESHGVEATANWSVTPAWRLSGSYSWLVEVLQNDPTGHNSTGFLATGDDPRNGFQFHSFLNLPRNFEFDASMQFVSRLPSQSVPSYTRFDARLGWRPTETLELSAVVQNAFTSQHQEFGSTYLGEQATLIPRSAYGKVTWWFRPRNRTP